MSCKVGITLYFKYNVRTVMRPTKWLLLQTYFTFHSVHIYKKVGITS